MNTEQFKIQATFRFSTAPSMGKMLRAASKLADLTWGPGAEVIRADTFDADVDHNQGLTLTFAVEAAGLTNAAASIAAQDQIRTRMDNRWQVIRDLEICEITYSRS